MSHLLMLTAAVAILIAIGYASAVLLLPAALSRRFSLPLAPGVGAGICSLIFFAFRRPMFGIEFVLLSVLLYLVYKRRRFSDLAPVVLPKSFSGVLLFIAAVLVTGVFAVCVYRAPHGDWDAWAIWNMHSRLLYSDGQNWMKDLQHTAHGDYPLLTPSNTARLWRYSGDESAEDGALIGIMLCLSSVGVLVAAVSELRDSSSSALFGFTLLGTPLYLQHATSQYADVPLSFFILAATALICIHFQRGEEGPGLLTLAGFCAGCAGWTKSEGVLFIVAICGVMVVFTAAERPGKWRRFVPFLAGLTIPLLILFAFKVTVPVPNDFIEYQTREAAIHKLLDSSRYMLAAGYFYKRFWKFGGWELTPFIPILAFLLLRGIDRAALRDRGWLIGCLTLGTVLLAYYGVYIITPYDLKWHLEGSLDRLMLHLWPSLLLLLALSLRRAPSSTVI